MTDIKEAQGLEVFTVPGRYLAVNHKNPGAQDVVLLSDATAVIDQLREELAKAHEYGYQYRQERNRAQQELAAIKSAPVVMPERLKVPMPIWKDTRQPYGDPLNAVRIGETKHFNLALDEVARLNRSKT